jgi:hypothetical protein
MAAGRANSGTRFDRRVRPVSELPPLLTYEHDRRLLDGWHPAG